MIANLRTAGKALAVLAALHSAAHAQIGPMAYPTLATAPNPRDFVTRQNADLVAAEQVLRFGGANIFWLGLRSDTGRTADARLPSDFEIINAFDTAASMGISAVRARTLAASVGCKLCVLPAPGGPENETTLRAIDHVLKLARDNGIKFILPLAGGISDCAQPQSAALDGDICVFVRAHGSTNAADFFTNPAIRADFTAHILALLNRVNVETGTLWREDPAIMAFETCDACAPPANPGAVGSWTADIAALIHANDSHHLVQSGAFAKLIGVPGNGPPIGTADIAPAGVDIVAINPDPAHFSAAMDAATAANRPVVLDNFQWQPKIFATPDDLQTFLKRMLKRRDLNGAMLSELSSHADTGGYLADTADHDTGAAPALYFPGITTKTTNAADMELRARAIRRFNYSMSGFFITPAFIRPGPPDIVSATGGRIVWRGSAGASTYSIARAPDARINAPKWQTLCDKCANDLAGFWQDPNRGGGPAWYQVTPYDANNHAGLPSAAIESK